jgi:glucokinase
MLPAVAVDLGGTNIRAALFPPDQSKPSQTRRVLTLAEEGPQAVIDRIVDAVRDLGIHDVSATRTGVAAPGPTDPVQGIVYGAPNLPGWDRVPLRDLLAERLGCPVWLGNDANLAALAEWRFGAGQGVRNLLYLTISTGIGGGAIIDGRLFTGAHGLAVEFGHMIVDPDGPQCGCGLYGHLESFASGTAIGRRMAALRAAQDATALEMEPTAAAVGAAARAGDPLALQVIQEAGIAIGRGVASLVHAFDPERVVLGGGVSQLGELIFRPARQAFDASVMHPAYRANVEIVPAALGDDGGLIGAMLLARDS